MNTGHSPNEVGGAGTLREREVDTMEARLIQENHLELMVACAAHEINTPISVIRMVEDRFEQVLPGVFRILDRVADREGSDDFSLDGISYSAFRAEALNWIGTQRKATERIVQVIENLSHSPTPLKFHEVRLVEVVADAVSIIAAQGKNGRVSLRNLIAPDLPPVRGDHHRLGQVFTNLIRNAVQAIAAGGREGFVEVTAVASGSLVVVRVRDNGIGIPAESLPRVTQAFWTSRKEQGGRGLGLYICHSIVKDHGGELSFESTPGAGTCVTVQLEAFSPGSKV